jgi:hypothetical protein
MFYHACILTSSPSFREGRMSKTRCLLPSPKNPCFPNHNLLFGPAVVQQTSKVLCFSCTSRLVFWCCYAYIKNMSLSNARAVIRRNPFVDMCLMIRSDDLSVHSIAHIASVLPIMSPVKRGIWYEKIFEKQNDNPSILDPCLWRLCQ